MSFSVWFKQWVKAFCKLLTAGSKRSKSDAQREKERERRLKAKYSSDNLYHRKKERRRRRSSFSVQNERFAEAFLKFVAVSFSILLLPFGLFDWGRKSVKARRASAGKVKRGASLKKAASIANNEKKSLAAKAKPITTDSAEKKPAFTKPWGETVADVSPAKTASGESVSDSYTPIFESAAAEVVAPAVTDTVQEPDENTPKSTPKHEKDQYIRKRMIIAGSSYCDSGVLDSLEVGTYFDLEVESDNPNDKAAVKLTYNGQKIGYIAKQDRLAFVTYLKIRRNIYGVITNIIQESERTKYEFETWFDHT